MTAPGAFDEWGTAPIGFPRLHFDSCAPATSPHGLCRATFWPLVQSHDVADHRGGVAGFCGLPGPATFDRQKYYRWTNHPRSVTVLPLVSLQIETLGSPVSSTSAAACLCFLSYLLGRNVGPFQTRTRKVNGGFTRPKKR